MTWDVEAFTDPDAFADDMDAYLRRLLDCKPAPDEERVVYPGVPEHEAEAERREHGIPYHPKVVDWFRRSCDEVGAEHAL